MNKVKTIKVKNEDGSISEESYSIAADAVNVDMVNGKNVQETIGTIDVDKDGDIAAQLNKKINKSDIIDNLDSSDNNKVLSAKQGKVLGDAVAAANTNINKKIYYFNTVAEMKAANLKENDVVQTLGYYEANDGGEGLYKIVNDVTLEDDSGSVHSLTNGLKATLIIENNTINFRQLGARPQSKDNVKYDNSSYIDVYLNYLNKINQKVKLYIPSGIWCFSETTVFREKGWSIYGDESFSLTSGIEGTIITSYNSEQEFVWRIGKENIMQTNMNFCGLCFSNANFKYSAGSIQLKDYNTVTDSCVVMYSSQFIFSDKLMFHYIKGRALRVASVWEGYFPILNFRKVNAINSSVIYFSTTTSVGGNISACKFSSIMFESVHGDLMRFAKNSGIGNVHFGVLNFEDYPVIFDTDETNTDIGNAFDDSSATHWSIIRLEDEANLSAIIFDSLELNNFAYRYLSKNGTDYVYDTILSLGNQNNAITEIKTISIMGINKNFYYLSNVEGKYTYFMSYLTFGNLLIRSNKHCKGIFDVHGIHNIEIENIESGKFQYGKNPSQFMIPFYKIRYVPDQSGTRGFIYRDDDSINKDGLVLVPKYGSETGDMIFARVYAMGTKMYIRAKIAEGQTARCYVNSVSNQLAGTGAYKWYTIDNLTIGDLLQLSVQKSTMTTDKVYYDCIFFA